MVNAIFYIYHNIYYIFSLYITHTVVRNGSAYYALKGPVGCERVHLERVTPFIVVPARPRALHGSMDQHQTPGVVFGACRKMTGITPPIERSLAAADSSGTK